MQGRYHKARIRHTANVCGTTDARVEQVVDLLYESIKVKLDKVDYDRGKELTEAEFKEQFKSVIVPNIGTFVPSYKKYINIRKKL